MRKNNRKIVIVNQAVNYLTIDIANAFVERFYNVAIITGNIHEQGEPINEKVGVTKIIRWKEEHGFSKILIYLKALFSIYYLLITKYRNYEVYFISVPPMAYLLNIILPLMYIVWKKKEFLVKPSFSKIYINPPLFFNSWKKKL